MTETAHQDPHHVVCVGDGLASRRTGATESLERICRVRHPDRPWRFWHQGDAGASAGSFLEEAIWRALGQGAGRLILSLGSAEAMDGGFDPVRAADGIRRCMDLLADKGPKEIWLLLPVPSLWPTESRPGVDDLRVALQAPRGRWNFIDTEPAAAAFLSAQSAHPDSAVALVEDTPYGPQPTGTGALLIAERIFEAWNT